LCVSSLKTTLWSPHTLQHSFLQQTGALGERGGALGRGRTCMCPTNLSTGS